MYGIGVEDLRADQPVERSVPGVQPKRGRGRPRKVKAKETPKVHNDRIKTTGQIRKSLAE